MTTTLDDKLGLSKQRHPEELLEVAPNPYIYMGKQLTRSEMYAALWSAAVTGGTEFLLSSLYGGNCPQAIKNPILAVVGPASEKPGLFIPFLKDEIRKNRKDGQGKSLAQILKDTWKEGWPILRADLAFHDSAYTSLQFGTMAAVAPETSLGYAALSAVNFLASLTFAAFAEVKTTEFRYNRFIKKLEKAGFSGERYHESRFLINPNSAYDSPKDFIARVTRRFHLPDEFTNRIVDLYPKEQHLTDFNKRKAYLRYRHRTDLGGNARENLERLLGGERQDGLPVADERRTVQIAHSLPKRFGDQELSLFKRYSSLKQKYVKVIRTNDEIPHMACQIKDRGVRKLIEKHVKPGPDCYEIEFFRFVARNEKSIYVAVDIPIIAGNPSRSYFVELKIRRYSDEFRRCYEFIGKDLPVDVTTKSKFDFMKEASQSLRHEGDAQTR